MVTARPQCFLLKTLDQPLNRYWSVCLPQRVYWLTLLDDRDDTFFLETEATEADDMVEVTELDESFLSMTPGEAQPSVVAVRGVCCRGQSCCYSSIWPAGYHPQRLGTHVLVSGRSRGSCCAAARAQCVQRRWGWCTRRGVHSG